MTYLDQLGRIRSKAVAVVEIQAAIGLAIVVQSNYQVIWSILRRLGGQPWLLKSQNGSTPDVHVDVFEGGAHCLVLLWLSVNFGKSVPVEPAFTVTNTREHAANGVGVGDQNRSDENGGPKHKLSIGLTKRLIIGKFPSQGTHDSLALGMGVVEESVHVGQHAVAHGHRTTTRFSDRGPAVGFLANGCLDVMIAVEWAS
jgi:hypothetical protein